MGIQRKSMNKMTALEKRVRKDQRGRTHDKMDQREEVMADSPAVLKLMRGSQRRLDSDWGKDAVGREPRLAAEFEASQLERFDFDPGAGTDFGMKLTMASGLIDELGIRPGDIVEMRDGTKDGFALEVVSVESATELRLEDDAAFGAAEGPVQCRAEMSTVAKS